MSVAVTDYFLKIDGIEGESHDAKHRGEIELESFTWSEDNSGPPTGRGSGGGRVTMSDFEFTTRASTASPRLLLAVASGEHFKSAVLTARLSGAAQQEFLYYKFSDLLFSSYKTEASVPDAAPVDQVSFNFGQIQVEYRPPEPGGALGPPIKVGWDVRANRPI